MKQLNLSQRLFQLRTKRQLPSQELAKVLGVEPPMYSKMEHGTRNVKLCHLQVLADYYNIEFGELYTLWVADKLMTIAENLPDEIFEEAVKVVMSNKEE